MENKMRIQRNLIKLNKHFETKEEAIEYCGSLLHDAGCVTAAYIPAMVQRNEELSVYMGNFIAIPHGTDEAKKEVKNRHLYCASASGHKLWRC